MAKRKFPPKGYAAIEYPLPHEMRYSFGLLGENEAKNSMIVTLIRTSEDLGTPETIEVNPHNNAFVEESGPTIHLNSIIPRMNLKFTARMTTAAIETDKMRSLIFNWMPIYMAFEDDYVAKDVMTNTEVEDILEMSHTAATGNKRGTPLQSTVKSDTTNHASVQPLNAVSDTEVFGDYNLTTNTILEFQAFDTNLFWDAMDHFSNRGKLQKVVGKWHTQVVTRDRPFIYSSHNFTYPTVKRGNPWTYCGILFHLPQGVDFNQHFNAGETTVIEHLSIDLLCKYDEWLPDFDQKAF